MNDAVTLAIVALLGTLIAGAIWVIKYLFGSFKPVLDSLVDSTRANTEATKSADAYLKQRNGRDIEFHTEIMKELRFNSSEIKRVGDLGAERLMEMKKSKKHQPVQVVDEQTVIHQTII